MEIGIIDPFSTWMLSDTNPAYQGVAQETQNLYLRQTLIDGFVAGEVDPEVVLDCLQEHGIDAGIYAESVSDTVDRLIWEGFTVPTEEIPLYLPR